MQTKTESKKDNNFKIRYTGIKFLYVKSTASLEPLSGQRQLSSPPTANWYQLSHSASNSSFQIKAKPNIFFYIGTDIVSTRGRGVGGRKNRKKKKKENNMESARVSLKLLRLTQCFIVL